MSAMTLIEHAKHNGLGDLAEGVIETFGEQSKVISILPFQGIRGFTKQYRTREKFPAIAFRGINETFSTSTSIINPEIETTKIFGALAKVDKDLVDAEGKGAINEESTAQIQASGGFFERTFFKGDSLSDVREFDGLQTRITGDNLIQNGTQALSLLTLDEAVNQCKGANVIFAGSKLMPYFTAVARTDVGGGINYTTNELGKQITTYNGIPLVSVHDDDQGNDILGFTEASSTTSIYVCNISANTLRGIQTLNDGSGVAIDMITQEPTASDPFYYAGFDWKASLLVENPRWAVRVSQITKAKFTA